MCSNAFALRVSEVKQQEKLTHGILLSIDEYKSYFRKLLELGTFRNTYFLSLINLDLGLIQYAVCQLKLPAHQAVWKSLFPRILQGGCSIYEL